MAAKIGDFARSCNFNKVSPHIFNKAGPYVFTKAS